MSLDTGIADYKQPAASELVSRISANAFDKTAAPGASDDIADGWSAGSLWYDSTAGKLYVCADATAGAAVWKQVALGAVGLMPLAQFYTDVVAGEGDTVDAYSYTLPANTLSTNGDSIHAVYAGKVTDANITQVAVYFAGTSIYGSDELNVIGDWRLMVDIIRTSATTARCVSALTTSAIDDYETKTYYATVDTGLDFTTNEILKLRLYAESSANDLVAKMGKVWKIAAA